MTYDLLLFIHVQSILVALRNVRTFFASHVELQFTTKTVAESRRTEQAEGLSQMARKIYFCPSVATYAE